VPLFESAHGERVIDEEKIEDWVFFMGCDTGATGLGPALDHRGVAFCDGCPFGVGDGGEMLHFGITDLTEYGWGLGLII